jgi:coenzyme F420-reducing hydrogenase alpha subunit
VKIKPATSTKKVTLFFMKEGLPPVFIVWNTGGQKFIELEWMEKSRYFAWQQQEYEKMYGVLGGKPVHATLAMHWARLIELLYSAERMYELITDKEITGKELRAPINTITKEGIGIVEAQRGTLTHHYFTDEKGIVTKANIIVGTTNNNAAICMSLKKAARLS